MEIVALVFNADAANTVIWLSLIIVKAAVTPLKDTSTALLKLLPLIVIKVFSGPLVGEKSEITGAGHGLL